MRVRVSSFSFVVFIRYREFNPRFVHRVHEVLDFFRVHGTAKRRDRHHQHHEYLQPFAFHRHKFLPAVGGKSCEPACGRNSPRKRRSVGWDRGRLLAAKCWGVYRAGGGRGEKAGRARVCSG